MSTWKDKYQLVKVKPGKIHTRLFGVLDFSKNNIPVEKCDQLYNSGFIYLEPIAKTTKANSNSNSK